MIDYYSLLEVSPNASEEVIKAAYRSLVKTYADNESKTKKLNEARILFDKNDRAKYDKQRTDYNKKSIGNYKVISEIAEGGFGRTYLAEHSLLKTPVCLKQAYNVSHEDELILYEEAKAIWDLRHYGIPNIRDLTRLDDGSLILVMSYVPGPTLTQIIDKMGGLEGEHVAWISERILNILKYLHFNGVVHGDVKPQNIIVQPETHGVVLVDYGLSLIRPSAKSDSKGYTPHFAAPEQVKGGSPIIPETDLYSLGMTMIYALGGNIETKQVPKDTPDNLCAFIKSLIKFEVLSRPNWEKRDLHADFQEIRTKDFGRKYSGMKPLKV
jgi:serine/threonine-protein kinase